MITAVDPFTAASATFRAAAPASQRDGLAFEVTDAPSALWRIVRIAVCALAVVGAAAVVVVALAVFGGG